MSEAKIWKFNQGGWNDGIWGREEDANGIVYTYMGKVVFLTNPSKRSVSVTVPFPVYGAQTVSIGTGDTIIKVRKPSEESL